MAIARIIPEFRSNNLAATEDLYVNVIGLQVDMREDSGFMMFSSPDNPALQLIVNDDAHEGLPPGFAIDVGTAKHVDEIHAEITERGLAVIEPVETKPWGIRRFSFIEHNGERVTIIAHTG